MAQHYICVFHQSIYEIEMQIKLRVSQKPVKLVIMYISPKKKAYDDDLLQPILFSIVA